MKSWCKMLVIAWLVTGSWDCQKETGHGFQSEGAILGPDLRLCACCGGWYIKIDGVTYEFDTLPSDATIDLQKATFPLAVELNWQVSNKVACPDQRIDILKIQKK